MNTSTSKNLMTKNVDIGLASLFLLIPVTLLANWHTANLNPQIYYTLALTHSLTINCLPYFLFGLLSFAFFHTKNGKRIALPANLTGIALILMWIGVYYYYSGGKDFTNESLNNMIEAALYLSFLIGSLPFVYFYFSNQAEKFQMYLKNKA